MFGLVSKTGGKVKIINVTEARANFAAVLSDNDAAYIITKNNKPQRAIISYAEYERLNNQTTAEQMPTLKSVAPKKKPAKIQKVDQGSSVKGLLKERMEMLVEPAPEDSGTKIIADPQIQAETTESFSQTEIQQPMETLPVPEDSTDYFGDNDSYGLEEQIEQIKDLGTVDEAELKNLEQALQKESGDEFGAESVAAEPLNMTPEEASYFQKYRKLYERRDGAAPQQPVVVKAAPVKAPDIVKARPQQQATQEKTSSQEELPSLEELLKDLNIDSSFEDKSQDLRDEEINDLINRITSD